MNGLENTLKYLNGVLLPGGSAEFKGKYWEALKTIFQHSLKSYDEGNPFPLWGTCLGFEELVCLAANNPSAIEGYFDSEHLAIPLELKSSAKNSRFFVDMPERLMKQIQVTNSTFNNHVRGISPKKFSSITALTKMFDVLSVNTDRRGKAFVSTIEGHVYPIWGTQWHPEKVSFEWKPDIHIPHSSSSVLINMYPATFFVDQCRKNKNKFPSQEAEEKALIYNYKAEATYKSTSFEQCYFF